ncbi:GAG-pre-integrase domain - like 8 [Theobroma cacao]|nr:GAG-pre-integrase domain - like 8 [Theobroma cacao]
MGTPLLRQKNPHDLYEWPTIESAIKNLAVALSTDTTLSTSPVIWHGRLEHPSLKIIKSLVHSGLVSLSTPLPLNLLCDSCLCNKSQCLPLDESTLESNGPFDLIYTDVWGPSTIQSVDGFYYYVIFVDHFTKCNYKFRQVIGALQYLSLTGPDVSYAVNKLAQFMHSLTETHCAFIDAYWAGNRDDRTSTSAYIVYLGGNAISWCSKKQKSVARLSTEAEYRALAFCAAEVLWIQNLLRELQVKCLSSPQIFCDKIGPTYLSVNLMFHSRMKHVSIDYHFVRDHVACGSFIVSHISSKDQLADALTKPLSSIVFRQL